MGNKPNAMLAKIEDKYRREYEQKFIEAEAAFKIRLDMALQQSADAALMAADDTFDVNEYSAERFHVAHIKNMNKIAHMAVVEDKDDPDMWWTKDTVDRRLLQIVGEKNFCSWDERYIGNIVPVIPGPANDHNVAEMAFHNGEDYMRNRIMDALRKRYESANGVVKLTVEDLMEMIRRI